MRNLLNFELFCCCWLLASVSLSLLPGVASSKKCYTRTLTTCVTNFDRESFIEYRVSASRDVYLDLRMGPMASGRAHMWRIVWAKDRAMRCLPQRHHETNRVEETPCLSSEYEQVPLGFAGKGMTYFRLQQCNFVGDCRGVCGGVNRTAELCNENFVLYADNCNAIDIMEVDSTKDSSVEICPPLGML